MPIPVRRLAALAAFALSTVAGPLPASARSASLTLDGLRDPDYVPLAQDPGGDLAASLAISDTTNWADVTNLYVVTDTTTLWLYAALPNYSPDATGEFGLALDTDGLANSGGTIDPWASAITFAYTSTNNNLGASPIVTSSTLLPDAVIRGVIFGGTGTNPPGPLGWTELRTWNPISHTWAGATINWGGVTTNTIGTHVAFAYGQGIELAIPYADLGISSSQPVNLEFYTTASAMVGDIPGAWDTVPPDDQGASRDSPTTERRFATLDPRHPPELPAVAFSNATYQTSEIAGNVPITLTVAPTTTDPVYVTLSSADGTASAASGDYVPISTTVMFAPSQAQHVTTIHVLTDTVSEPDETVLLSLSQPVGVQLGAPDTATLIIHDSPPPPTLYKLFLSLLRR